MGKNTSKSIYKAAWAEISVDGLEHNLRIIRSGLRPGTAVCAVLKADAYGHGAAGIRKKLAKKGLVEMAAVGKMSELISLTRETGDDGMRVLLLGASKAAELEANLKKGNIRLERSVFSIFNMHQFRELNALGRKKGIRIHAHIRIDGWGTGMGLGFWEYLENEKELFSAKYVNVCGLYSHLYSSYSEDREETLWELKRFDAFVKRIHPDFRKRMTVHILNSALVFCFPEYAYDMVRVGTALYGLPCGGGGGLRPVLKICAEVFDVREVDMAAPLSYKSPITAGRRKIARIMLGYWDCPLLLTQKDIRILIRDRLFCLADDPCMDNLCIDVTGSDDISVGDVAVILGEPGVFVEEILERNEIDYVHSEWMSMTAGRLEKVYL